MTTYFKAVRPDDGTDFYTGAVQWAPPEDHEGEWIVRHPTATEIGNGASEYLSVSAVATDCTGMAWPCRLLTVEAIGDVVTTARSMPNKRAGVAFRVTGERPAHEALGPQGVHVAALIDRTSRLTADEQDELAAARDAVCYAVTGAAWDAASGAAWAAAWDAARGDARDAARNAAWAAAWDAARGDARGAARDAAWDAAWDAAGEAARDAARDAAWGAAGEAAREAAGDAASVAAWAAAWDAARGEAREAAREAARDAAVGLAFRDLIATEHYDTLTRPWRTVVGPIHPDDSPLPATTRRTNHT